MATTNYIDNSLPTIGAAWLNDVDATVYEGLGGAITPAAIKTALALAPASSPTFANVVLPALGLVDGRDVSVDGAKLDTISAGAGPSSNSFVNIAVATQGTVIATTPTDTLTLAAGANIGITTVPGTDTITLAVTGTVPNATNAVNATNATNATNSTTVGGLTPGNNSGNIPINNGVVNTNLNAQLHQGYLVTETATASRVAARDASGFLYTATPSGTASDLIAVNRTYYFANLPAAPAVRGTTWTSFTVGLTRLIHTTYTNNTGKTIVVNVAAVSFAAGNIIAIVNSVNVSSIAATVGGSHFTCSIEVPNGQTYRIDDGASAWTLTSWAELL